MGIICMSDKYVFHLTDARITIIENNVHRVIYLNK